MRPKTTYKTRIGITPFVFWGIALISIIYLLSVLGLNPSVISIIIVVISVMMVLFPSYEIVVKETSFQIRKNRFFNLIKKGEEHSYDSISRIDLYDSKFEIGTAYIPIIASVVSSVFFRLSRSCFLHIQE